MPRLFSRFKPAKGFSHFLHIGLNVLLPVLVYILVRIDFVSLAIALILLSKWRMFAVRPRYWGINILSNGVDILVAVSLVLFMANTSVQWWQLFWALCYAGWLVLLKPRSDPFSVSVQAMIGQLLALLALYLKFGDTNILLLILGTWGIAYLAARHYLSAYGESHPQLLAYSWAYFAASLAFLAGHWLLFYGVIAQPVLLLTGIGYGLAALYYLHSNDRLSAKYQRQIVALMGVIIVLVLVLSDWAGKTV